MQRKENFYTDNEDLRFHLTKRIDFDLLHAGMTAEEREANGCASGDELRTMVNESLGILGEITGGVLAPRAAQVEKDGVELKDGEVRLPAALHDNITQLINFGCAGIGVSPHYGGLGAPFVFQAAAHELIMRACPSTGLNIVWYTSIGHIVERFGDAALKDMVLPRIVAGEWSGSMALTEPDAGSDLAALRTYGERQPDGSWLLHGTKRFISNGCGQVALVLAKNAKGAEGLSRLNLFLCLKTLDGKANYQVTRLEEKLGLHGSATCELAFDGAKAWLLGEDGKGFQHMLHLMNEARIAVGLQGVGHMDAIFRMATDYATQRRTWGKPLVAHELVAEQLLNMEVELKAARSLCYQAAYQYTVQGFGERMLKNPDLPAAERKLWEERTTRARRLTRRWTPLIKWYTAEKAVEHARVNMQIHGGYGYTREYRAEWWLRESLILPIYEGTSQIQALMCVKDTLKDVIRNPRAFVEEALGIRVRTLRAADPLRKKLYRALQLERGAVLALLLRLVKTNVTLSISEAKSADLIRMVKTVAKDVLKMQNVSPALLNAERLCEIRALTAAAGCLVRDAEADPERRWVAERFLNKTWPRLEFLKAELELDEPVLAGRLAAFAAQDRTQAEAAAGGARA